MNGRWTCVLLLQLSFLSAAYGDPIPAVDWELAVLPLAGPEAASDTQWVDYAPGTVIGIPGVTEDGFTYHWLRASVSVPVGVDLDELVGLRLPGVFMKDRCYLNGVPVGVSKGNDFSGSDAQRQYLIPSGVVRHGENTLLVQIGCYYRWSARLSGPVVLTDRDTYQALQDRAVLFDVAIPFGIVVMLLGISASYLVRTIITPAEKSHYLILLRLVLGVLCLLSVFSPIPLFTTMEQVLAFWIVLLLGSVVQLQLLYQALSDRFFRTANLVVSGLAVALAASSTLLLSAGGHDDAVWGGVGLALVLGGGCAAILGWRASQRRNDPVTLARLERTLGLLRDGDGSIVTIAFDAGFESLSTFNRLFKSRYGVTPGRYRDRARALSATG